jgi:hypothetical protein
MRHQQCMVGQACCDPALPQQQQQQQALSRHPLLSVAGPWAHQTPCILRTQQQGAAVVGVGVC